MAYYDWKLAIIGTFLVLLATGVVLAVYRAQLGYQRPLHTVIGQISGLVLQLINGIEKLRVAAAERRAFAVWAEKFAQQRRHAFDAGAPWDGADPSGYDPGDGDQVERELNPPQQNGAAIQRG